MIPFTLIPARPIHHAFIVDSWVACDMRAPGGWRERGHSISGAKTIVRGIIAEPGVTTTVAVLPDDDEAILGYVCHEPGAVHFVYLRAKFGVVGFEGVPILRGLLEPMKGKRGEYTHSLGSKRAPKGWTYAG